MLHNIYEFFVKLVLPAWPLLTVVFIVVVTGLFLKNKLRQSVLSLLSLPGHANLNWQKSIFISAYKPLQVLITTLIFSFILSLFAQKYQLGDVENIIIILQKITIIFCITFFFLRLIKKLEYKLSIKTKGQERKLDKNTIDIISKLLYIATIIIASMVALQTFGVSVSAIVTFGGLSGLAVSLAAKDFIASIFGTISLYFDKLFVVGDIIKIGLDKPVQIEGMVEKINWRFTQVRTNDKRVVYIPNSQFSTILLENSSLITHKIVQVNLEATYTEYKDIMKIIEAICYSFQELQLLIENNPFKYEITQIKERSFVSKINLIFDKTSIGPVMDSNKSEIALKLAEISEKMGFSFNATISEK